MPSTAMDQHDSVFSQAVEEFATRPTKKKRSFIQRMWEEKLIVSPEEVHASMFDFQKDNSQRASRKVLKPVFDALRDYDRVMDVLVSADPMPSAFIWGGLKAVIICFQRYNELFERLENQMGKLVYELRRLNDFEELFITESAEMRGLLVCSYIRILEFWDRVERQCNTCKLMLAVKSLTSFSTRELDETLTEMTACNERIIKLMPIIQERRRRGEHQNAKNEWIKATADLEMLMRDQRAARELHKREKVLEWIGRNENETNDMHHNRRVNEREPGTGNWILKHPNFVRWLDTDSAARILWLNGGPGVGKSFICAYVVQKLEQQASRSVAYHYFRFDEHEVSPLAIYRNIASSLFCGTYKDSEEVPDLVFDKASQKLGEQSMKSLIEAIAAELDNTFIFLDGVDEECSNDGRWKTASQVLKFFIDLAERPGSTLKLWCSSQDWKKVRDLIGKADQIHLGPSVNNDDIEKYCRASLQRDFGDINVAVKDKLLEHIKHQVNGNFLWAASMLPTLSEAESVGEMQRRVHRGLPEGFEKHLTEKLRGMNKQNSSLLRKVLSCVVYAKRPLLLDELCEAVQIINTPKGEDMRDEDCIRQEKLFTSCESLLRFDGIQISPGVKKKMCTLWHASFRTFLVNNPDVLGGSITCEELAKGCLNYLQQPKYDGLLSKVGQSFSTISDEDIADHHLLVYSAKYWRSHMDSMSYTFELCQKLEDFVRSRKFITCLQVQSLLVGGWFSFWFRWTDREQGKQLVRVFPRWFSEQYERGAELHRQYNKAIGEWGYYLDQKSLYKGSHRGNLRLCLWATLGKTNFLSRIPSDFKSFIFEGHGTELGEKCPILLERIDASGTRLEIFKLEIPQDGEASCSNEIWTTVHGRSPKLVQKGFFKLEPGQLELLLAFARDRLSLIAVSECGKILRIGSRTYIRREAEYKVIEGLGQTATPPDELSATGAFFAVTWRRRSSDRGSKRKGRSPGSTGTSEQDHSEVKLDSGSASDSGSDDLRSESSSDHPNSEEEAEMAAVTAAVEPTFPGDTTSDSDSFRTRSSQRSFSARWSSSEGSTEILSDVIEDEAFMNDFDSDSDPIEFDEDASSNLDLTANSDDNSLGYSSPRSAGSGSIGSGGPSFPAGALRIAASRSSTSELAEFDSKSSDWEPSTDHESASNQSDDETDNGSESAFDSDDENESDQEHAGLKLGGLLEPSRKNFKNGTRCEVQVFRDPDQGQSPQRLFRFIHSSPLSLFASPPVFHHTKSLLVWPLGDGEILFADYKNNTYFIRRMRFGYTSSCQISVQCRFSPCGAYLHIVSLDGFIYNDKDGDKSLGLRLHVSTHRLSERKTSRSPPRLVYRNALSLPATYTETIQLSVSTLPYTLTWAEKHVYVTHSETPLKVYRIPLYKKVEETEITESAPRAIFVNAGEVYLPSSVETRKIYFFDGDLQNQKKKSKDKEQYVAKVIMGAQNRTVVRVGETEAIPRCDQTLPQGVHLTESQFGKWEGVDTTTVNGNVVKPKRAETWKGGQLDSKFERFDRSEDCDIVPYLGF